MQVTTHPDEPLLLAVGGGLVEGWLLQPACRACGSPRIFVLAYSAICCPRCNEWQELSCPDPGCWHCRCRPDRPWPAHPEDASSARPAPWGRSERATNPIPPASRPSIMRVSNRDVGRK